MKKSKFKGPRNLYIGQKIPFPVERWRGLKHSPRLSLMGRKAYDLIEREYGFSQDTFVDSRHKRLIDVVLRDLVYSVLDPTSLVGSRHGKHGRDPDTKLLPEEKSTQSVSDSDWW